MAWKIQYTYDNKLQNNLLTERYTYDNKLQNNLLTERYKVHLM